MTRYEKKAAGAIKDYLRNHAERETVPLYTLSCVADRAARDAGKKRELFYSLYDYENLVPDGTHYCWVESSGLLSVYNPYYRGKSETKTFWPEM